MTPAELITRKLKAAIEAAGATLPVYSLLLEALDGEKQETPSSGIALNVHIAGQLEEPLPHYSFSVRAILTVSLDDDKGGEIFKASYDTLWAVFDNLARNDNCVALGDEGDELAIEVFRRTGYLFGIGLATYASLINPEAIIVTGGISHAGRWLMEPTRESFENHVFRNMRGKVRIIQSDLNDAERDVLGASALAWEVPEYSLFK